MFGVIVIVLGLTQGPFKDFEGKERLHGRGG